MTKNHNQVITINLDDQKFFLSSNLFGLFPRKWDIILL